MRIPFEEWKEKYKPRLDYCVDYIPEGTDPFTIWTEGSADGDHWIASGYHFVNRVGYWITEIPFKNDEEVVVNLPEDEYEEILLILPEDEEDEVESEDFLAAKGESQEAVIEGNTFVHIDIERSGEFEEPNISTKNMVAGDGMSLEEQIAYHLENDFAVPYSADHIEMLIPLCKLAIETVNRHEQDTLLDLPGDMTWTSYRTGKTFTTSPAYEVVRIFGLASWLNESWK